MYMYNEHTFVTNTDYKFLIQARSGTPWTYNIHYAMYTCINIIHCTYTTITQSCSCKVLLVVLISGTYPISLLNVRALYTCLLVTKLVRELSVQSTHRMFWLVQNLHLQCVHSKRNTYYTCSIFWLYDGLQPQKKKMTSRCPL